MTPGYLEILNDSLDIVGGGFFGYFCHSWWHLCSRRCLHTRRENWFFLLLYQTHDKAFKYNANNYKLMYPAV